MALVPTGGSWNRTLAIRKWSLLVASGHITRIRQHSAVLQCGSLMIVAVSHLRQQWQELSRGSAKHQALAMLGLWISLACLGSNPTACLQLNALNLSHLLTH